MLSRSGVSTKVHCEAVSVQMAVCLPTLDGQRCCNTYFSPSILMINLHRYIASLLFGAGAGGAATFYLFRSKDSRPAGSWL